MGTPSAGKRLGSKPRYQRRTCSRSEAILRVINGNFRHCAPRPPSPVDLPLDPDNFMRILSSAGFPPEHMIAQAPGMIAKPVPKPFKPDSSKTTFWILRGKDGRMASGELSLAPKLCWALQVARRFSSRKEAEMLALTSWPGLRPTAVMLPAK